jgi:hypothetical protein
MSTEPKELPKQELLIKLLGMTTSTNDPEALSALRKANALLRSAGWDWEKLVRGRITVIADPFTSLATPTPKESNGRAPPPMTPTMAARPTTAPPRLAAPPPQAPVLRGTPTNPISTHPNAFAGHCHCCGIEVVAMAGTIFHSHGNTAWKIACSTCNTSATVNQYAATKQRYKRGKKSISDLA